MPHSQLSMNTITHMNRGVDRSLGFRMEREVLKSQLFEGIILYSYGLAQLRSKTILTLSAGPGEHDHGSRCPILISLKDICLIWYLLYHNHNIKFETTHIKFCTLSYQQPLVIVLPMQLTLSVICRSFSFFTRTRLGGASKIADWAISAFVFGGPQRETQSDS